MRFLFAILAFIACMEKGPKHSHTLMFFVGMWILWHTCRRSMTTPGAPAASQPTSTVCARCHTASTLT